MHFLMIKYPANISVCWNLRKRESQVHTSERGPQALKDDIVIPFLKDILLLIPPLAWLLKVFSFSWCLPLLALRPRGKIFSSLQKFLWRPCIVFKLEQCEKLLCFFFSMVFQKQPQTTNSLIIFKLKGTSIEQSFPHSVKDCLAQLHTGISIT